MVEVSKFEMVRFLDLFPVGVHWLRGSACRTLSEAAAWLPWGLPPCLPVDCGEVVF